MQRKTTPPKRTIKQAASPTVDSPDQDTPAAILVAIEAHRVFLEMEIMAYGKGTPSGAQARYRGCYERAGLLCKADPSLPPLPDPETDPDAGLHTLQLWCIKADTPASSLPRLRDVEAGGPQGDNAEPCKHSDDFTSVLWFGKQYCFSAGQQAGVVRLLWEQWERGTPTLCQETIAENLGAEGAFRLANVFRERRPVPGRKRRVKHAPHPAWGKMIVSVGRGVFALKEPTE